MNQDFKEHLNSVPVSSLLVHNIIDAEETEPISFVFQRLLKNRILSVPVYSVQDGVKHYFGFADIMDVLYSYLQNKSGGHHKIVGDIVNLSERNPWLTLNCEDSILRSCTVLSGTNTSDSVHRCAVLSSNSVGKDGFFSILSQSKVVQYISEHIGEYPIAKKTVAELQMGFRDVISVDIGATVLEGLSKLAEHKISGVAVTQKGKIVGNISASDLNDIYKLPKGLAEVLHSPIADYFEYKRRSSPIFLHPEEATLETVCQTLVKEKIHRLYLVEGDKAVGLITLSNILALWADKSA
eukprot:TRINITY_DN2087_c0_g1_i1.p1 TRINITY_DN2087_c0_g1~~TRINITY_DN2087_c0_g1_i1.p1  ORF type:complete len:304 (+),score=51.57 TRINITY_DN2087_c0_g1_i1:25-912(+)